MKKVILCVDDEQIVLTSLKMELEESFGDEYIIEYSLSGNEAITLFNEYLESGSNVPVVIVDFIMPGMKGDELLEEIAKISPDTKGIMLTGQATTEGIQNAVNNAGLYRFLTKPWNHEDIIMTITEALKSYDMKESLDEKRIQLEKLNNQLQQLDKSKNYFLDLLSHEINTPLNAIKGFSELLKANVSDSESMEYCDLILESTKRLGIFADYSLMITRLMNEKYELRINKQNIYNLIVIAQMKLKKKLIFKDITINKILKYENMYLDIDPKLMETVFQIILHNAIRFSEENSTILIKDHKEKGHYAITISDNGSGFDKKKFDSLFQFFISDDLPNHSEGHGLGLAMAKIIMESHNGKIEVNNREEGGAEVSLIFKI